MVFINFYVETSQLLITSCSFTLEIFKSCCILPTACPFSGCGGFLVVGFFFVCFVVFFFLLKVTSFWIVFAFLLLSFPSFPCCSCYFFHSKMPFLFSPVFLDTEEPTYFPTSPVLYVCLPFHSPVSSWSRGLAMVMYIRS